MILAGLAAARLGGGGARAARRACGLGRRLAEHLLLLLHRLELVQQLGAAEVAAQHVLLHGGRQQGQHHLGLDLVMQRQRNGNVKLLRAM